MSDVECREKELIDRALTGDETALAEAFTFFRPRLEAMVRYRMSPRLRGRVDVSDVLQDSFIELSRELPAFSKNRNLPFFVWLRLVTAGRLMRLHRHHLGAEMRDAGREVSIERGLRPQAGSAALATRLLGDFSSVSGQAIRAEAYTLLNDVLEEMDPIDREILTLRHLEELTNREAASELGLKEETARKRHLRAAERLRDALEKIPDFLSED